MSDCAIDSTNLLNAHVFNDDAFIPAGMYVLLHTGAGEPRWVRSKDGALVYYAYMNRTQPVWANTCGPLHVLSTHHTYSERKPPLVLR